MAFPAKNRGLQAACLAKMVVLAWNGVGRQLLFLPNIPGRTVDTAAKNYFRAAILDRSSISFSHFGHKNA
ncbi:MAG: hypothetical protein ACYDHA_14845, partial [Bellilinea sp.]